ncbi:MAG: Cys-tRNA(Pro) deacylase, partial [Betaproteobacteria bacterium]|nr:Cys-tRNA(Pro) deacylase [Betaproteobacteria bacterium]
KALAPQIGVKKIEPCKPEMAERHSGYRVGGTSPFGTRKTMPVYLQRTVAELARIYINGGSRGFLVSLAVSDLQRVLQPQLVDAAIEPE